MIELSHLAFFSLGMCFVSFWIHRSTWLWGAFLTISLILALQTGVANSFSLIPIGTLGICHFLMTRGIKGTQRWIVFSIAIFISVALIFHWIPGFCNWRISEKFWINYDRPFTGLFPLAFALPLLRSQSDTFKVALKTVPLTLLGIFGMVLLVQLSGTVSFEIKWPSHFFLRAVNNLILVSISEEAFFRGFVQEELFKRFGQRLKGHIGSVLVSSIFFTFMHIGWSPNMGITIFVFLAGLLYGSIYQYTRAIESSIFCHFILNMTHMVFFSYHAM